MCLQYVFGYATSFGPPPLQIMFLKIFERFTQVRSCFAKSEHFVQPALEPVGESNPESEPLSVAICAEICSAERLLSSASSRDEEAGRRCSRAAAPPEPSAAEG